jgi:hypothetical protein
VASFTRPRRERGMTMSWRGIFKFCRPCVWVNGSLDLLSTVVMCGCIMAPVFYRPEPW